MKRRIDLEFREPANYPEAIYWRHPAQDIDPEEVQMISVDKASSAIRFVIAFVVDAGPQAYFAALKLALASDIVLDPSAVLTMRELAKRQGVTRAAVSKEIKEIEVRMGLKCSRANKRTSTSETYRATNVRRHKNTFIYASVAQQKAEKEQRKLDSEEAKVASYDNVGRPPNISGNAFIRQQIASGEKTD
jgi:hypothetical protein